MSLLIRLFSWKYVPFDKSLGIFYIYVSLHCGDVRPKHNAHPSFHIYRNTFTYVSFCNSLFTHMYVSFHRGSVPLTDSSHFLFVTLFSRIFLFVTLFSRICMFLFVTLFSRICMFLCTKRHTCAKRHTYWKCSTHRQLSPLYSYVYKQIRLSFFLKLSFQTYICLFVPRKCGAEKALSPSLSTKTHIHT